MMRRALSVLLLAALVLGAASCSNKKVKNPIANIDSKQPDKVLFDRAMDAMKHTKYDVARMTLQTLINTYPDSEYVARAKLAVGDSWYAEGGSAALAQAEIEYKDFITFFPNLPEAAEAQLKVANIHYKQMEKPDRDFTHAMRAEDEYKQLILQWPDSKLVPEAKQRLREVQEVLAEREYRIGHFYYMREMYPAAIARLQSLADAYPLYSQVDDALFTLGQAYEREAEFVRNSKLPDKAKEKLIAEYMQKAGAAYTRLITRYPVMDRAKDAQQRLAALHLPVPTPTAEAIAQNKAEQASRHESGLIGKAKYQILKHGPDVSASSGVGEPTMVEPQPADASAMVREANRTVMASAQGGGAPGEVAGEIVKGDGSAPGPNQPPPSSSDSSAGSGTPAGQELTPNTSSGAAGDSGAAQQPPLTQVNEAAQGSSGNSSSQATAKPGDSKPADSKQESSSKSKKKKGLRKLVPF